MSSTLLTWFWKVNNVLTNVDADPVISTPGVTRLDTGQVIPGGASPITMVPQSGSSVGTYVTTVTDPAYNLVYQFPVTWTYLGVSQGPVQYTVEGTQSPGSSAPSLATITTQVVGYAHLVCPQNTATPFAFTFLQTGSTNQANLNGKTIELSAWTSPDFSVDPAFVQSTADSSVNVSGGVVTVSMYPSNTATAQNLYFQLFDATDKLVLERGVLEISTGPGIP